METTEEGVEKHRCVLSPINQSLAFTTLLPQLPMSGLLVAG